MTLWTFADAHPWAFVALALIAALCGLVLLDRLAPPRKPPPGGAS